MDIRILQELLQRFIISTYPLIGNVAIKGSDPLDAAIFPSEIAKLDGRNSGLYIIWDKSSYQAMHVGIAPNISQRIYEHIGKGFSWANNGSKAYFPNCSLPGNNGRQDADTQKILREGGWNITAIFPDPVEISGLVESFLLFWGWRHGLQPEKRVEAIPAFKTAAV